MIFVALFGIWLYFFMPRLFEPQTHILQRADLSRVPGVMRVEAHPPSVFVTIDSVDWGRMGPEEQLEVVKQIGRVADESGYVGADIRGDDGVVIGRWFKQRGAELVAVAPARH